MQTSGTEGQTRANGKTDLVALVRSRGVHLRPAHDDEYAGNCPFCSCGGEGGLRVNNRRFCCSACAANGDAVVFLARFDGLSLRHAFEVLSSGSATAFNGGKERPRHSTTVPRLSNPVISPTDASLSGISDAALLNRVATFYHTRLTKTSAAMALLKRLGPRAAEAVPTFGLGFADRTLGFRIPRANRKQGHALRLRLRRLGIYRATFREHLNGCLVIPVPGAGGDVGALFGYRIAMSWQSDPLLVAPAGIAAGVWNGAALTVEDIVLATTPLDALALWAHGVDGVTFTMRPLRPGDALTTLLLHRQVRRVRLAYAASTQGEIRAETDAALLAGLGIEVCRVKFPWGFSAAACAVNCPTARAEMTTWVDTARLIAGFAAAPDDFAASPALRESAWDAVEVNFGDRAYRVSGLANNRGFATLRASVRLLVRMPATGNECRVFLDRFDLARDLARRRFVTRAAHETDLDAALIKRDIGRLLLAIEQRQYALLAGNVTPHGNPGITPSGGVAAPGTTEKPVAFTAGPPSAKLPRSALSRRTREVGARIRTLLCARCSAGEAKTDRHVFMRRDVRAALGLGATQTRLHLERLVQTGQIKVRSGSAGSAFRYMLNTSKSVRRDGESRRKGCADANLSGGVQSCRGGVDAVDATS